MDFSLEELVESIAKITNDPEEEIEDCPDGEPPSIFNFFEERIDKVNWEGLSFFERSQNIKGAD